MTRKEILCPHCDHKPFRNETGLEWHIEHQHGSITKKKEKAVNQIATPVTTEQERQSTTELPRAMAEKVVIVPEVNQKRPSIPDIIRSRGATMSDFERLLNRSAPESQKQSKEDQIDLKQELANFKNDIEKKLDARLQIFTERDAWLSGRIAELEEALKSHILR
jgi:DNA anti-recombination protein RmuC